MKPSYYIDFREFDTFHLSYSLSYFHIFGEIYDIESQNKDHWKIFLRILYLLDLKTICIIWIFFIFLFLHLFSFEYLLFSHKSIIHEFFVLLPFILAFSLFWLLNFYFFHDILWVHNLFDVEVIIILLDKLYLH